MNDLSTYPLFLLIMPLLCYVLHRVGAANLLNPSCFICSRLISSSRRIKYDDINGR